MNRHTTLCVRTAILERQRKSRIVLKRKRKKYLLEFDVFTIEASIRAYFLVCIQCVFICVSISTCCQHIHTPTHTRTFGLAITIERIWLTNAIDATKKLCVLDSLAWQAMSSIGKKATEKKQKSLKIYRLVFRSG